jgi:hypothetical protein
MPRGGGLQKSSVNRDGLDYSVRLNLADTKPHVPVTASGQPKPRKQTDARAVSLPPPIPVQRCRERAQEVEWFLPENRERGNAATAYWRKHQARYQELFGMAEEFLRAELEYWRELELLSGQRARFKPGLTDETAYADDEVAA